MAKRYYRLQMKLGSDGETITDEMLSSNIITSDVEYAGEQFNSLRRGDIVLVHKGAFAQALVEVNEKVSKEKLSKKSLGVDYTVRILSWFDDIRDSQQSFTELWGSSPPTGTFQPVYSGNQTYDRINAWYNYIIRNNMMKDILNLLELKKQIVLQGPPGTGKTRMAKQLAMRLTAKEVITADDILQHIKLNQPIDTSTGYSTFVINAVEKERFLIKLKSTGKEYGLPFVDIIKAYKEKKWIAGTITNGTDTYTAATAKFLNNHINKDNLKIIQFHPAYSYEDFVRGIIADTSRASIEYKPVNKVLGEFAERAKTNFDNSNKDISVFSRERWVEDMFNEFAKSVSSSVNEKPFPLNKTASIIEVESDAFRYTGSTWKNEDGHRMKFSDIIKMYLNNVLEKDETKIFPGISGSAWQHFTYYFIVLNKFRDFINAKPKPEILSEKPTLNKYVLIIDEINRANLPAVLGELIYALEYRGKSVESIYEIDGDRKIVLPPNLYIIGTMNTADRSVGHIDYAIRRRFAFVDVLPSAEPVKDHAKELFKEVSSLFVKNYDSIDWANPVLERSDYLASDFRPEDVWLGHSYFITKDKDKGGDLELKTKLDYEIRPLLKEYIKDGVLNESAKDIVANLKVNA